MSHFIKLFALCLLISPGILLQAQQPSFKDRLYVEADVHYGFVMPHISPIAYFITDHVKGFQLNVGIHTFGDKKWQQYYNYPRLGIGFYHSGLGNNEVFGQVNALFGYMDRYFFRADRRFNIGNRLAFGMAYINKKYDLRENYFDVAIGSHVNVYINYSLEGLIRLSPVTQIKLGLGMMHVSNGRFKEPNKGLNLITTFVGLQYSFHNPGTSIVAEPKETDEPGRNQLMIACSMGKKQISRKYDYSYTPTALSLEYARKVSRTSWIGMAFTTYYDPSLKKEIEMKKSITGLDFALLYPNLIMTYNLFSDK